MELRQLRYFVTVAEELHFGRAAHRLRIVQPAVSQQVRRLERELGVDLFDRSPRHVRLTVAGERLLPEAKAALAAADRVAALASSLSCGHHSELRIGVGPGVSGSLQPGLIRLRETAPELTVRLSGGPLPEQLEAARTGRIDLLVVRGEGDWSDVETFELRDEPVHVALPRRHPLADSGGVRLEQLAGLALRLPAGRDDLAFSEWIRKSCRQAGFAPQLGREVERISDALVEIGNGDDAWTVLGGCADDSETPGCVALVPVRPELRVPVRLVVPAWRTTACVRAVLDAFARPETSERLATTPS